MSDIKERLRGKYPVGPVNKYGNPEFGYRKFDGFLPPIQEEAAAEIERLEAKCERLEAANWQPISKLLPEHGEVLIFAPDETPSVVAGSLVACENGVEHYVQYSEELLNDAIGEVFNPTYFAEISLPTPPEKGHE